MSKEIDGRIDALRERLVRTANTPIGMGNYKQQMRAYQEMMLELINIVDTVNVADDTVSPTVLEALRKQVRAALDKPVEGDK